MSNDFGAFDRQENESTWRFWPRSKGKAYATFASGTSFMSAREVAAVKLGCAGQDMDSEFVESNDGGAEREVKP